MFRIKIEKQAQPKEGAQTNYTMFEELYEQTVEDIDLIAVIKAINKIA